MNNVMGYILIQHFPTDRPKVCEAPRHIDLLYPIPAYAVIAIQGSKYPNGLVQMVCKACWDHFDKELGHPNWNLMGEKKNAK